VSIGAVTCRVLSLLPAIYSTGRQMKYRPLGRTGWNVSEISFGAWAIGGAWGHVSEEDALGALRNAIDSGVNFIDTADVYGDGRGERLVAQLKKECQHHLLARSQSAL